MYTTRIYDRLKELSGNGPETRALLTVTEGVYQEAIQLLKATVVSMPQYTLHDQVHVDGVIEIMGRLLPDPTLAVLKPLELAALILAAALQDVGMAASREELDALRNGGSKDYASFRAGYPKILARIESHRAAGKHPLAEDLEWYLVSEYLRQEHGNRCKKYIINKLKPKLCYGGNSFSLRLAEVCLSHTRGAEELQALPCWEVVRAGGERCNWRFVAILLRLADVLDFDAERTPRVLFEHLGVRDAVSLREWGKHLAVNAWDIGPGRIAFSARCA
jgi:hypothetical protein